MVRHIKTPYLLSLICTLLLASLLAACAPSDAPADTEDGATEAGATEADATEAESLRVAIIGDESTINPYTYITGYPGWNLLTLQYDTLYQMDADGVPQPWLATGSTVSDDGLTVTIDLRDDVTWHDGAPFTAADVKFTFDYFQTNATGRFARDLRPVAATEVGDDTTVILTLTAPAPSLELSALADVPILPSQAWEGVESPAEHTFDSVSNLGTGPYVLSEYEPDQFYRFTAYADYFAGAPAVGELVAIQFADDAGALAALRGGEVDMIVRPIAPEQIDLLSALPDVEVAGGPLFTTQMINYDVQRAPFDQLAVRQAMALAIDKQDIIDTVYLGTATVGSPGWIHPVSPVYNDEISNSYDPEAASALLDEAGITDSDNDGVRELDGEPLSFEFLVNGSDSLRLRIAELVSEMLGEVGIEANVASVEQATWEEAVWPGFDVSAGRNYDMAMWGWSAPVQADATRTGSLVHSDPAVGSLNLTGYANPDADALAEAISTETDPAASAELIGELQAIIADELPFILLLYPDGAYAYNSSVYGGWVFMSGQGIFHKLSLLPESAQP